MKKAIGVIAGVVVVAGAAWAAGAWYTGERLEAVLRQRIDEGNARLQALLPGGKASLSLESLDRHLFSTDARLQLRLRAAAVDGQPAGQEDVVDIAAHIGHGPFPLERVKRGQLMPVMAAGTFALQENDTVRPWFALTQGAAPLSGHAAIGYSQSVSGTVTLAPVKLARDGNVLDFSGLALDFSQDADKRTRLDGAVDTLSFKTADAELPSQIEVTGITLATDMRPGPADLQVGSNVLSAKQIAFTPANRAPVILTGYTQRTEASAGQGGLALHGAYDVSMLNVAGQDVGQIQVELGAKSLAPEALKTLATLYGRLWSRGMEQAQAAGGDSAPPDLTPEEQAQALAARQALLAGNPNFYINPILLKTPRGEARFTLSLDLADPGVADQPMEERIARTLRKLDARVSLAQPLLAALLSQSMQRDGMDATTADAQAQALSGVLAKAAADSGYATVQGSDIVSTLHYADRVVDLNGTKMPLEQFAGLVLQGAMGMMGQSEPDMDTPDDAPDAAEPDEDGDQTPAPDTGTPPSTPRTKTAPGR
jgi:uncharacterized protein YdgA (DUF945 family)